MRLPNPLRTFLASLVTGYIFFYFSELVFWARPRPGDSLPNWLSTWFAYSLMAFLFLAVVSSFRARSLPALFLAGAFFGWLGEGVLVQTAYESLPLSLSFTGLAWHALITVVLGWYGLQKALRAGFWPSSAYAAALGLFLFVWSIAWIYEEPHIPTLPGTFALFNLAAALLLALSLSLVPCIFTQPFAPSRWAVLAVAGLSLLYFLFVTIPAAPISTVILPLLMLLLALSLRRSRQNEPPGSLLEQLAQPLPARNLLAVLWIPLVASPLYALYWASGLKLPTNWLVYIVTTPIGFILFGWALWQIWQPTRDRQTSRKTQANKYP